MNTGDVVLEFLQDFEGGDSEMLIRCVECGGKAIIQSRHEKHIKISDLYCSCKDPQCGASFVMNLSYSRMLSPSARQSKAVIADLLRMLPRNEQIALLEAAQQGATG